MAGDVDERSPEPQTENSGMLGFRVRCGNPDGATSSEGHDDMLASWCSRGVVGVKGLFSRGDDSPPPLSFERR